MYGLNQKGRNKMYGLRFSTQNKMYGIKEQNVRITKTYIIFK